MSTRPAVLLPKTCVAEIVRAAVHGVQDVLLGSLQRGSEGKKLVDTMGQLAVVIPAVRSAMRRYVSAHASPGLRV